MVGQPYSVVHFKPFCIHLNYRHMYPYLRYNLRLYLTGYSPYKTYKLNLQGFAIQSISRSKQCGIITVNIYDKNR